MPTVRSPGNFNLPALSFSEVKEGAHARYVVPTYGEDTPNNLILQTPELRAPFGISNYEGKQTIQLELSSKDAKSNALLYPFYQLLESIDRATVDWLHRNQWSAWPQNKTQNKTWSRETVESLYHGLVKPPQDARWPATIRVKLQDRFGVPPTFFGPDKTPMKAEDLEQGAGCTCLVELGPIYIMAGSVYPTMRLIQCWESNPPQASEVQTTSFDFDLDYASAYA